ncbi:class I SAM-dependent methyltransferase [Cupriavidus sp. 2TAF22]|uniref:class I SAM-dependent methyltransferase n=1 Tax=unclassified Cupriavidus TaxID=2640874 RepID=UPI003F932FD4
MDTGTLQAYSAAAADYARDWHAQQAPADLYAALLREFTPGPSADIGCGAGRDTAWLAANGFEPSGFDPCEPLLAQARQRYPTLPFEQAALPELEGVPRGYYQNVLCETVIMHLEPRMVASATRHLLDILRPGGTLYLSWRVTDHVSQRDQAGRFFAAFDKALVTEALGSGDTLLFDREEVSQSSGKRVHRLIVRKALPPA